MHSLKMTPVVLTSTVNVFGLVGSPLSSNLTEEKVPTSVTPALAY